MAQTQGSIDVVQREIDAQAVAHKRSSTWEVKEMEPISEEEEYDPSLLHACPMSREVGGLAMTLYV